MLLKKESWRDLFTWCVDCGPRKIGKSKKKMERCRLPSLGRLVAGRFRNPAWFRNNMNYKWKKQVNFFFAFSLCFSRPLIYIPWLLLLTGIKKVFNLILICSGKFEWTNLSTFQSLELFKLGFYKLLRNSFVITKF